MDELALRREIALRDRQIESMASTLERMETDHITWSDADGNTYHPDWCRACRVDGWVRLVWLALMSRSRTLR